MSNFLPDFLFYFRRSVRLKEIYFCPQSANAANIDSRSADLIFQKIVDFFLQIFASSY